MASCEGGEGGRTKELEAVTQTSREWQSMFDLSDVRFVKRISVGTSDPGNTLSDEQMQQAADLLNRCLTATPRGTIIAIEKSFKILNVGEHQVVLQWIVYHVGFARKPAWLE